MSKKLTDYINTYMDFPEPGIAFKDVMPLLWHPEAMQLCIEELKTAAQEFEFDFIAGFEARGFLFGTPLAYALKKPFVPLRKAGKLPGEIVCQGYALEYGEAVLEMQLHMIGPGSKVLLFDDLLATGGTLDAGVKLIEKVGAEVAGVLTMIELAGLQGRTKLQGFKVRSLVEFE